MQRFVAKRMGATIFETDSSHVPMLSQPGFVLDVIRKAALERNLFSKLCISESALARMRSYERKKITSPSRGFEV